MPVVTRAEPGSETPATVCGFPRARFTLPFLFATVFLATASAASPVFAQSGQSGGAGAQKVSVFAMPKAQEAQLALAGMVRSGDLDKAAPLVEQILGRFPTLPFPNFVAAVLSVRKGDGEGALGFLETAFANGFRDPGALEQNALFNPIRNDPRFADLLARMKAPAAEREAQTTEPRPVQNGEAEVEEDNTGWDPRLNLLQSSFTFNSKLFASRTVDGGQDKAADLLNDLFRGGKAAGNIGDLYDNRDRGHSPIAKTLLPQVAMVKYGSGAKASGLDYGFNSKLFYNAPAFGNSSVGVNGMFSVARMALGNPREASILYLQYRANQLYVYPSVHDYSAKTGDAFTANTPYTLVSLGKSRSDKPFLHAVANILAAFKPDVKKDLIARKLLMPTVQMVFRRGLKGVESDGDYLSGKAHPVVFDGERIDREKMIRLANGLESADIPPMVALSVLEESDISGGPPGMNPKGVVFDTPSALGRVMFDKGESKRLVVDASGTDANGGSSLQFHWVVLEGDRDRIRITPQKNGSAAEIVVPWHGTRPSANAPEIKTNRVDIGVFAQSGKSISAPAIISIYNDPSR